MVTGLKPAGVESETDEGLICAVGFAALLEVVIGADRLAGATTLSGLALGLTTACVELLEPLAPFAAKPAAPTLPGDSA